MGGELTGLSFSAADFMFNLKIRNPNHLGMKMAGFDYNFLINGDSFIKGKQDKGLQIAAEGESTVQVPVSLNFVDLYQGFQDLKDQDNSTYRLDCGFSFDVPVLGVVNIPVSKEGELPMLKLPKVSPGSLELKNLALSGAELLLKVEFDNPNAFSMLLERLQYQFDINGLRWVEGDARENIQVAEKGKGVIEIPIHLNFREMGRSVYQILTGNRSLGYQFGGSIDLATSLPLLGKVNLPFDHSGSIEVIR